VRASDLAKLNAAQRSAVSGLFNGLATARPLSNFVRVTSTVHAGSPLGFGPGSSRFSPRRLASRPTPPFGLIYGTVDLATGVYETIVRDSLDIMPACIMRRADYRGWSAINFSTRAGSGLNLVDLTSGNAARFGVPTDVVRYSNHKSGQFFSEFVYANMPAIDGMLYTSRFTELLCVAVYDRAIPKLIAARTKPVLTKPILQPIMAPWNIQVL